MENSLELKKRFWQNVNKHGPIQRHMKTPCWIFTMKAEISGYGAFRIEGRTQLAHRVSWFLQYDVWPAFLLHECDVRRCVNPLHLGEGNYKLNAEDRVKRDRSAKGSRHGRARLNESDIATVDVLYFRDQLTTEEIARRYGVSRGAITHAVLRHNWKHIPISESIKR